MNVSFTRNFRTETEMHVLVQTDFTTFETIKLRTVLFPNVNVNVMFHYYSERMRCNLCSSLHTPGIETNS